MRRKFLSIILSICLVLTLLPGMSYAAGETEQTIQAATFPDIEGHWAREAVEKAVADGYVRGYPDGRFLPERAVSRAEFVSMVNNALQLRSENKVQLAFSDVKESDWFSEELAKAGYVRYIKGTSVTTFSPDDVITRQEAALMLSRFLPKAGMTGKDVLDAYPDRENVEAWAEEGVAITLNKGYMRGHANGLLAPLGTLTRAEAVTLIGQILARETIVREDVFVKVSGDILSDKIYVGDITIDEEVGEGDATLQNLSALSVVYVNGGGSHTVTMENSLIIRLVVTKEGTQVRVLAADGTTIYTSILFNNNLLVDEQGGDAQPDGETFEDIVVVQGAVTEEQARQIAAAISAQVESGRQVTPQQVTQAVQSVLTNSTTRTDESGTIVVEVPATPGNTGGNRNHRPPVPPAEEDSPYLGEPNDTPETATPLVAGEALEHYWIMPETDTDWFSFTAEAGQLYRILTRNLYPAGEDEEWMDTVVDLYADPAGVPIAWSDDFAGLGSGVLWTCDASGTYYIRVMHYDQYNESVTEDSTGRYDILVREENIGAAIVNGGFETGDFTGWDVGPSGQYPVVQDEVVRSGDYAAHLSDGAEGMFAPGGSASGYADTELIQLFAIDPEEGVPMVSFYYKITNTDAEGLEANDWMEVWLYYPEIDYSEFIGAYNEDTDGWQQASYIATATSVQFAELHVCAVTTNTSVTNNYYLDDVAVEYLTEDILMQDEPNEMPETATQLTPGQPATRWIYPYDDQDGWVVELTEGERYEIRVRDLYPEASGDEVFMTTNLQIGVIGELMAESSSLQRWEDDGINESYISFIAPATGPYLILVSPDHPDWSEGCYGRYTLSIEAWSLPSMESAIELEPGETVNGDILPSTDIEWYKFSAEAGMPYVLRTMNLDPPTSEMFYMVTYMSLYDSDGSTLLASSDSDYMMMSEDRNESFIEYTFGADGDYYVTVEHRYPEFEEATGSYTILLETGVAPVTETPVIDSMGWNEGNMLVHLTGNEGATPTVRINGVMPDYLNWMEAVSYYADWSEPDPGHYVVSLGPVGPEDRLSFCLTAPESSVSAAAEAVLDEAIPVVLTAAGFLEEDYLVTFDDDEIWRAAVTGVWADGVALDPSLYEFSAGQLVIDSTVALFDEVSIFVEAEGYLAAWVTIGSPD